MQAPRSIRLRLIQAASSNNVREIERLVKLDMATSLDYELGLSRAIYMQAVDAAIYLKKCAMSVPREEQEHESVSGSLALYHPQRRGHKNIGISREQDCVLLHLVLTATNYTWMMQLAEQAPDWFLRTMKDMHLEKYARQFDPSRTERLRQTHIS
jgi:hypothetical protein